MKCRIRGHISVGVNATLEVISVVWISEPLLVANENRSRIGNDRADSHCNNCPVYYRRRAVLVGRRGQEAEDASAHELPPRDRRATRARDRLLVLTGGQRSK